MYILGISAYYHDSAACLIKDGNIIAAAQEERFSRIKHDARFPVNAVNFCLDYAKITSSDLDYVCYYDKPLLTFERLLETYLRFAPKGIKSFSKVLPLWVSKKLHIPREIRNGLGGSYRGKILFSLHHLSHAASAFFPSPFEKAAIITVDGVGEWSTTTIGKADGNKIKLLKEIKFPHSLGLLYSAFTYYLGFRVNSGEYKMMGLAPYGEPRYVDLILEKLIDLKDDGSFQLDMKYFNYCTGLKMTSAKFHKLFGMPPKKTEDEFTDKHLDLAASIQEVMNIAMLRLAEYAKVLTSEKNLVMAGGTALNSVANGLIRRTDIFENIWIQPAAGDAGGALGCALAAWHIYLDKPRKVLSSDSQQGSFLGSSYSTETIKDVLDGINAIYQEISLEQLPDKISEEIEQQNVVGLFQGRMEFGPRALGSRSIIADARSTKMQSKLNLKIKFREGFRPFAPAILREKVKEYFQQDCDSPYMLLVEPLKDSIRVELSKNEKELKGINKLSSKRSSVPVVTHIDYTGRLQTVTAERNGFFYKIINAFYKRSGCPLIVNTSFNIRGEPIVNTPLDAYRCFMFTDMDTLVLENLILYKKDQPEFPGADEYRKSFKPD